MKKLQIGVMGPSMVNYPLDHTLSEKIEMQSKEVGKLLAEHGAIVLTGGCDGVMEDAMKGAKEAGGMTIGFPGRKFGVANKYCDVEVLSDIDVGSFALSGMLSSHALITFPIESAGTMAEIMLAYRHEIPNVLIKGYSNYFERYSSGFYDASNKTEFYWASSPKEAVDRALLLGKERLR